MKNLGLKEKLQPKLDRNSHPFLLVGNAAEIKKLKPLLKKLKIFWEDRTWENLDFTEFNRDLLGILFIDLKDSSLMETAIKSIRKTIHKKYPIFAVLSDQTSDLKVRGFYDLGATAVFEWPLESLILARLLSELLGMELIRGKVNKGDTSLARSVRAHMRLMKELPKEIKIQASHGIVSLSGTIESLPKKNRIDEMVSMIPGVTGVNLRSLTVLPSGIPDKTVSQNIKKAVRITRFIDESTFTFDVQNGQVTLAGTLEGTTELKNLMKIVSEIKGVRNITNLATLSPKQKKKDHVYSTSLKKFLKFLYPNEKISVKYFGGIAVLTGQVKSLSIKKNIQNDIETRNFIERVVNKIQIK